MSGFLVSAIVIAIGFVALGLQILSRQIQRTPVDVRRPDPLIDVSSAKSVTVRPAELHQLVLVISNAIISDASARTELQPMLDELSRGRPGSRSGGAGRGRDRTGGRGRGSRHRRIEQSIAELERQWGLADDTDRA